MAGPDPKYQFKKGNKAASAKKGKKHKKTLIREKMGLAWKDAENLVEENILELLSSKNAKTRNYATKNFAEFIKPKKKEVHKEGEEKVTVKIIYGQPTKADATNHPTG